MHWHQLLRIIQQGEGSIAPKSFICVLPVGAEGDVLGQDIVHDQSWGGYSAIAQ